MGNLKMNVSGLIREDSQRSWDGGGVGPLHPSLKKKKITFLRTNYTLLRKM